MTRPVAGALALILLAPALGWAGELVGSIEFQMGLGSTLETPAPAAPNAASAAEDPPGAEDAAPSTSKKQTIESDMAVTLGITPAIEKMIGRNVGLGLEWMFLWVQADDAPDDADRRLLMSPHARLRLSFGLTRQVTFDGMLGLGPTIWTEAEDVDGPLGDLRFGWSLRFGFGVGYAINDAVAAFAQLGHYQSTTYGDDLEAQIDTLPLAVGLRGQF